MRDDGPRAAGARRPSGWIDKTPVVSRHFRVATANPLATEAGHDILRNGGNAIDAAVVVQLVLGLVEPQSSGLGGCSFMLYHGARSHRLFAYGLAPYARSPGRRSPARIGGADPRREGVVRGD